jgi:dTDP-D-glucose 4,6-dehydratase
MKLLKWLPKVQLEDGLKKTIEWFNQEARAPKDKLNAARC